MMNNMTLSETIHSIQNLREGGKKYISLKKNVVLMFQRFPISYRVVQLHKSDILGCSCFVKSFGLCKEKQAIGILCKFWNEQ